MFNTDVLFFTIRSVKLYFTSSKSTPAEKMLIKNFKKIFYLAKIIFNIVEGNFYFPYLLTHSYNKAQ